MKQTRRRWRHGGALLGLPCLLSLSLPAAAQQVTVESVLSAPFPSDLTASPTGGQVAWVLNDQGVRNVWIASGPDYRGHPLTRYTEDDGQEIGNLAFTPDGAMLVYVRGGAPNRSGEIPNPTSNPSGAERALWYVSTQGGEPVRIGSGSSPAISPRGNGVAYLSAGKVWWTPLQENAKPEAIIDARGSNGSLRFSPDGSKLAFVSGRSDHSFVGVYDLQQKTIRWMAPGVDQDRSPVWSPDGQRLAFVRTPASSDLTMFRPVREAMPWGIWVADVATGEAREIWRADPGAGSVFQGIVADNPLFWGANDRIVFPWEKTGWKLLYSVPARGGAATLLTPGEFEVEYATLGPDGREIFYNSNQDDIDRRHLWRVPVGGGSPVQLTRGSGIEWAPTPTADGRVLAYLRADARTPAHAVVQIGSAEARELAPGTIPADFPSRAMVVPERITITAADGMPIPADLFLPRNHRPGERRPALIFIHGGSRRQMLLGFHYSQYYHNAYALNQYFANQGYVVLSLNYRSGTGYGMEFREALNYGATGGAEFYDVLGAGLYLKNRSDVDPQSIGLWGGSYGGYLTAMGLSRASGLFAAGVDIHGVHDWNVGIQTFIPSYNPLAVPEEANVAFMASPMATVDTWESPVLLIHGDDDRNVSFAETVTLVEALRKRDVHVELLVFPDEVHSFLRHANWLAAYRATDDFFDRHLRTRDERSTQRSTARQR